MSSGRTIFFCLLLISSGLITHDDDGNGVGGVGGAGGAGAGVAGAGVGGAGAGVAGAGAGAVDLDTGGTGKGTCSRSDAVKIVIGYIIKLINYLFILIL